KDITIGTVTVTGVTTAAQFQVLAPDIREKKHPRIWLLPIPVENVVVLILGKRKIRPLITDQDTPIITGCQHVLIAGAAADIFQRLGNTESANQFRQKAEASSKVLVSLNTDQSAYAPRILAYAEPYPCWTSGGWK